MTGIDADPTILRHAGRAPHINISLVCGDVMQHPLPEAAFDFITAVATLHHLPLIPALQRFKALLRPGGVLAIIGLYRLATPADYLCAAVARPTSLFMRQLRPHLAQQAAVAPPETTLRQIRNAANPILPGVEIRRRLYFRYSLVWRKPAK